MSTAATIVTLPCDRSKAHAARAIAPTRLLGCARQFVPGRIVPKIMRLRTIARAVFGIVAFHPQASCQRWELAMRTVLDELRFEVVRQLVSDTELPLPQISAARNFSESTAFTRAFERWSGEV